MKPLGIFHNFQVIKPSKVEDQILKDHISKIAEAQSLND
jgi:hypothetical protein